MATIDPGECYNTINTYPAEAEKLRSVMKEWESAAHRNPRGFTRR